MGRRAASNSFEARSASLLSARCISLQRNCWKLPRLTHGHEHFSMFLMLPWGQQTPVIYLQTFMDPRSRLYGTPCVVDSHRAVLFNCGWGRQHAVFACTGAQTLQLCSG